MKYIGHHWIDTIPKSYCCEVIAQVVLKVVVYSSACTLQRTEIDTSTECVGARLCGQTTSLNITHIKTIENDCIAGATHSSYALSLVDSIVWIWNMKTNLLWVCIIRILSERGGWIKDFVKIDITSLRA